MFTVGNRRPAIDKHARNGCAADDTHGSAHLASPRSRHNSALKRGAYFAGLLLSNTGRSCIVQHDGLTTVFQPSQGGTDTTLE
ncbi:hypothetical protein JR316_0008569 [Psilocybe cubensis]|uniref:Uncharacterized protein n=1 Tax=Psilocybe cubensis TaxID=181762 RepID=A0ACB8GX05_PSICU|nr:hypothetical protein JR316_0008569 [Psilocybe cubensis]KAH9479972.1 hypothetical protein JR316_0008569 [Psilocybe cubensis]